LLVDQNILVVLEEEVGTEKEGPHILQSEVEKVINKWSIRKIQEMMMYLWV